MGVGPTGAELVEVKCCGPPSKSSWILAVPSGGEVVDCAYVGGGLDGVGKGELAMV